MNEEKPVAPRRRFPRWAIWLVLLAALPAGYYWLRPVPSPDTGPAEPDRPSYLDLLDPAYLADKSWPRADRPAEAVGVLDVDSNADGRLHVSIEKNAFVLIKNGHGDEVRIPCVGMHRAGVAVLSPNADRLVVLGVTTGALESREWAQVWRLDGRALKPLEAQLLEGRGSDAAAFSADGKLLATTSNRDRTDIWEVGEKELKHLGKISGARQPLLFSPDGRSLAAGSPGSFSLYDLGPILPGGSGWARWLLPLVVLILLAWACGRSSGAEAKLGSRVTAGIRLVAILGAIVCLGLWTWQFCWPSPSLLTASDSDLAGADIRSACFSADGSRLAALRFNGRLSLFDTNTGKKTHDWRVPEGVQRLEYAGDGRHLLAVADKKTYVLRLKPCDTSAFVLSCSEKVLEKDPNAIDALLARGHVHLQKGELDGAIADFTAVIALDAANAAAYHGRGLARTDGGDYAGARDDFAVALCLDPNLAAPVTRRPAP
jgi:hypothetical protein